MNFTYRLCKFLPDGSIVISPFSISPETAARQDLAALRAHIAACQKAVEAERRRQERAGARQMTLGEVVT